MEDAKKLSQNTVCHSERSEESLFLTGQTLRFAQSDSFEIVTKPLNLTDADFETEVLKAQTPVLVDF
jgi:hypothetical protein